MKDKYQLTRQQNIFLAKKVLVSNIYNSAKLEGINTTYPDTLTILEGVNVPTLKLDEINCILNLRDAWNYTIKRVGEPVTLEFICAVNSYVSRNESLDWGVLRNGNVGIHGVDYVPSIPDENSVRKEIMKILDEQNTTRRAISLMLYLMRSQLFWDGNKRTSMIVANQILISNGCGIITIPERFIGEFNRRLTEYYNTNQTDSMIAFLYENCIFGLDIPGK